MSADLRLLWFNLITDADAPVQGFATDWINALAPRCHSIDVLTMQAGRIAVADNVRVFSVGKEKGYGEARRAVEFYRLLTQLLWEGRCDACFAHIQALFAIMGAPLLKPRGIPITLWYAHKAVTPKLRLAEKLVDHIVTPSPESFRINSPKTHVIGHGIDTNTFVPAELAGGTFTMITVSRIAPVKRLETIITAAHLLRQTGSDFRLRIVGNVQDEAYAQRLRQQVIDCDLAGMVEFAGEVAHHRIAREYQQAHLMLNVSATGSIDKAVLEAMACGLPVITANEAFRVPLAAWSDQLLVPLDAPEELSAKIGGMMALSPAARRALGQELRAIVVRDHSLDRLVDRLMSILEERRA